MSLTRAELAALIDHTLLRAGSTAAQFEALCEEARTHGFATVCVPPTRIRHALICLEGLVRICTVIGFPLGASVPAVKASEACLAIAEPQPLFDPTALKTTAVRTPSGYRIDGVKSLVPAAAEAELFVIAAQFNGKPTMFLVEADTPGLTVRADRSMGLRAAAIGQVELDKVSVPLSARLGEDADEATHDRNYSEAIALSRLGWAAMAVGTSHAVLD